MHIQKEKQSRTGRPVERSWTWVPLTRISPYLIQSVIAAEDREFFLHKGFNWEYIWTAAKQNIKSRQISKGGSSITQQVAKNLFLDPSRTFNRKMREALITYRLEKELSKERILEIYLNVIEWGPGVYGAEAAARTYFGKSASELSLSESIRLATALPNPNSFHPMDNENGNLRRVRRIALTYMLQQGWVSKATYVQALEELFSIGDHSPEGAAQRQKLVSPPAVAPELLTPDYWIARLPDPDKIVMTPNEIQHFNKRALIMSGGIDLFGLPDSLPGKEVSDKIVEAAKLSFFFAGRQDLKNMPEYPEYYDRNGILNERFYAGLLDKLNVSMMPRTVAVRYAVALSNLNICTWPEDRLIMSRPRDYELNRNHQSTVCPGTPVAVLHSSRDGRWAFIRTPYLDGWVKKEDLAWTTRENAMAYPGPRFLVVTAPSVRTASGRELPLGTPIPLIRSLRGGYEVKVPDRKKNGDLLLSDDFLGSDGISEGFLPYTKRNAVMQAFRLLNKPFDWGKSSSGWDCSGFIQDTFSVFGINLPRNSGWQAKVSEELSVFDEPFDTGKSDSISDCTPAVTLLWIPGHIMLYLGETGGKPYAIHALYGVNDRENNLIKVNKITVTGLELGGEGRSLLDRVEYAGGIYMKPSDFRGVCTSLLKWVFSNRLVSTLGFTFFGLIAMESAVMTLGIYLSRGKLKKDNKSKD